MTVIEDEELLDLIIFLENSNLEWCDRCGWSTHVRAYGSHQFCRDCVTDMIASGELGVCRSCGEVLPIEELTHYENERENRVDLFCDSCARSHLTACSDCGRVTLRSNSFNVRTDEGVRVICDSCRSNYNQCSRCGMLTTNELIEGMCPDCYDDSMWKGVAHRYSYHDFDGSWNFYKDEDGESKVTLHPADRETIYMGTETEIDCRTRDVNLQTTLNGLNRYLNKYVHYERDGSLSGNGIEIISMPMTLTEHMKAGDRFKSAFEYATNSGYKCDRTTGLHVHVSTTMLETKHFKRLIFLLDKFRINVINLSFRQSDYAHYYEMKRVLGEAQNSDFSPTGSNLTEYMNWLRDHSGHGIYLNFNKYPSSIEFRMFQGQLNYTYYIGTLQFVESCIKVVLEHTLDDLRACDSFKELFGGRYQELDELISASHNSCFDEVY